MEGKLIKVENGYVLMVNNIMYATDNDKLSLKNCQAIANGYDLDALAREACDITDPLRLDSQKYKQDPYFKIGFNKGFQKALEILGGKKFSEKDMRRALSAGLSIGYGRQFEIENKQVEIDSYIKSLQQTEWDVEIEMDICGDKVYAVPEPALDENGCLILKRK